jgi:ATP adenylyltransferase
MFVNHDNTRARSNTDAYGNVISQIAQDGVCPFCPEHLEKYHKKPIIEKKYWVLTDNMYPYKPSLHHKLIIHKEHITHINELSSEAWVELQGIIKDETVSKNITGGTLIMRFGNSHFTGASVSHLHAHIVQSNPEDLSYDQIKGLTMRIG